MTQAQHSDINRRAVAIQKLSGTNFRLNLSHIAEALARGHGFHTRNGLIAHEEETLPDFSYEKFYHRYAELTDDRQTAILRSMIHGYSVTVDATLLSMATPDNPWLKVRVIATLHQHGQPVTGNRWSGIFVTPRTEMRTFAPQDGYGDERSGILKEGRWDAVLVVKADDRVKLKDVQQWCLSSVARSILASVAV